MTYLRLFGALFGVVVVPLTPAWPGRSTQVVVWALVASWAVGGVIIHVAFNRMGSKEGQRRVGLAAFAFDCAVIGGLVWAFAYERPYVTWAILLLLPIEGALRYRMRGALLTAGAVAAFFAAQSAHRASILGAAFDLSTYVFVVGLNGLVAGIAGIMAENWLSQSRALEEQSHRLAEADRLKDRFLAITSHEIRGPLAAIITGIDTVRRRGDRLGREQTDRLLEMVAGQGHQLARLVDDLLVTSQLQAHSLALHTAPTELAGVIQNALEGATSKRNGHIIETHVQPVRCMVDGARLCQIVRNLVENAFKYTPEGTVVRLSARSSSDGLVITVADEGPGLPADKRTDIFEAFARIDETAAGQDGVGLGLFVVSQLVTAMEGRIELHSSSQGTTFEIFVPCPVDPIAEPPRRARPSESERRLLKGLDPVLTRFVGH